MLPVRDDNPQINRPIAIYIIIGLNVLTWFLLQGFGSGPQFNASICYYGLIPADLFSHSFHEASASGCGLGGSIGWTGLISSMFMHSGWMHIIGNLWFLWVFGDNVEDAMGSTRFVIFYIFSGLCAAAAQILANPASALPMVGASGAIGGVMGAYIILYPRVKVHLLIFIMTFRVPAFAMLGYWMIVQLIGGVSSLSSTSGGVAFWAHIGGFIGGAILVFIFKDDELLTKHPYYGWKQNINPEEVWNDPNNRQ